MPSLSIMCSYPQWKTLIDSLEKSYLFHFKTILFILILLDTVMKSLFFTILSTTCFYFPHMLTCRFCYKLVLLSFQQWRTISRPHGKNEKKKKKKTQKTVRGILHYSYIKEKTYVLELLSCHYLANCETVVGNESEFFSF